MEVFTSSTLLIPLKCESFVRYYSCKYASLLSFPKSYHPFRLLSPLLYMPFLIQPLGFLASILANGCSQTMHTAGFDAGQVELA